MKLVFESIVQLYTHMDSTGKYISLIIDTFSISPPLLVSNGYITSLSHSLLSLRPLTRGKYTLIIVTGAQTVRGGLGA